MKKNIFMIIFILVISLIILLLLFLYNESKDISNKINSADILMVDKFHEKYGVYNVISKEITDKDDIKKIRNIIKERKPMKKGEIVPYRSIPHYKLRFLDRKEKSIIEISFFYFGKETSWIVIDGDENYYIIDSEALLEIIE